MIAFRVSQGFVGGAMIPTVFATGFALFTGPQRAMIPAILGMVSVLAPTLGPTVGGWLTDAFGWRSIFYVNIVPGIIVTFLAASVIKVDRPNLAMLKRIDYAHLGAMAVFLGGLEYVLEEGPRYDWFSDLSIAMAGWISFVAFLLFLECSFRSNGPIVKLTPFRHPMFVFACLFNLVIGFGLYSATYLIPVFLGRVRDYNSLQIGTTVFVTSIAQILSVVIAAKPRAAARARRTRARGFAACTHAVVQRGVSPHGVAVYRGTDHGSVLPARIEYGASAGRCALSSSLRKRRHRNYFFSRAKRHSKLSCN